MQSLLWMELLIGYLKNLPWNACKIKFYTDPCGILILPNESLQIHGILAKVPSYAIFTSWRWRDAGYSSPSQTPLLTYGLRMELTNSLHQLWHPVDCTYGILKPTFHTCELSHSHVPKSLKLFSITTIARTTKQNSLSFSLSIAQFSFSSEVVRSHRKLNIQNPFVLINR